MSASSNSNNVFPSIKSFWILFEEGLATASEQNLASTHIASVLGFVDFQST